MFKKVFNFMITLSKPGLGLAVLGVLVIAGLALHHDVKKDSPTKQTSVATNNKSGISSTPSRTVDVKQVQPTDPKPTTSASVNPTQVSTAPKPTTAVTTQPSAPTPPPVSIPVPTGPRTCPAYPAFPNASCTGVPSGTVLAPSGAITVTVDGTILNGLDITGTVTIKAANVVIKNSKIHGGDYFGIRVVTGNVTVSDTEIYGFTEAAIVFDNWAGYRLNIHDMGSDGLKLGTNTHLEDSYIHDFATLPGAHADGAQMQSGETNIIVRHNWINPLGGENSALFFAPDLGPSAAGPIIIDKNLLGGGNYTLYIVDGNNGQYHESGYSLTDNRFLRNAQYGATRINEPLANFTNTAGNVYDDNNQPVAL